MTFRDEVWVRRTILLLTLWLSFWIPTMAQATDYQCVRWNWINVAGKWTAICGQWEPLPEPATSCHGHPTCQAEDHCGPEAQRLSDSKWDRLGVEP